MNWKIIKQEDREPFKYNENNTVDSDGIITIEITDDDKKKEVKEYGRVKAQQIINMILAKQPINIDNCFVENLSFKDFGSNPCEIKEFSTNESFFSGETDFSSVAFSGDAYFISAKFSGKADFFFVTFSGEAVFSETTFSGDAVFNEAKFSGKTDFIHATFSGEADFIHATFSGEADFSKATFSGRADFIFATFSGEAVFSSATFSGYALFISATFSGEAYFSSAKYSRKAVFIEATFSGKAVFSEATFSGEASFFSATFSGYASFFSATFSEKTDFQSVRFQNKVDWNGTKFERDVNFINAFFEHPVNFSGLEFSELDLTGVVFDKYALFKDIKIKEGGRETFRIIKNEFMKVNNRIDSLDYHKREMEAYRVELKKDTKKWDKLMDKIVLRLNKYSNCYGTNWFLPIVLTIGFGIIMFILYNYSLGNSIGNIDCCKYFEFLSPFHKFDFMVCECKLNICSYLIDSIARLGIGYGYYQIIQAFRKFKIW